YMIIILLTISASSASHTLLALLIIPLAYAISLSLPELLLLRYSKSFIKSILLIVIGLIGLAIFLLEIPVTIKSSNKNFSVSVNNSLSLCFLRIFSLLVLLLVFLISCKISYSSCIISSYAANTSSS